MKRFWFYLMLLLGLAGGLYAAPWAMEPDYDFMEWAGESARPKGEGYMLRPILKGRALKIALWIENEKRGEFDTFAGLVKDSYHAWFKNAVHHINATGRKQEFQDVLPYVDKEIRIVVGRTGGYDVKVFVHASLDELRKSCSAEGVVASHAIGCYHKDRHEVHITKKFSRKKNEGILLHELGHSLGFADQYYEARFLADQVYVSDSTDNVMSNPKHLTCDDADGLINLIDLTLGLRRDEQSGGWKSLCPKSNERYIEGMSNNTDRYRIECSLLGECQIEEYEEGRKISSRSVLIPSYSVDPFAFVEEDYVVKRDGAGRPALVKGKNGEDIYYTGAYERLEKVVVKGNDLISYELAYPRPADGGIHLFLTKIFSIEGSAGIFSTGTLKGELGKTPIAAVYERPVFDVEDGEYMASIALGLGADAPSPRWRGPWEVVFKQKIKSGVSKQSKPQGNIQIDEERLQKSILEQSLRNWGMAWPNHINSTLK